MTVLPNRTTKTRPGIAKSLSRLTPDLRSNRGIIAERLTVVFCGINPGMTAAVAGHHFVRRSNRFWRVIHLAGFTPEEILPENDRTILQYGYGLTTVVDRPTASADQLSRQDFVAAAAAHFEQKIARYAPHFVGFLGKTAYSVLSDQRDLAWGPQPLAFGKASVWVLPNPSGRNRAFTLDQLIDAYRQFYLAINLANSRPGNKARHAGLNDSV